MHSMYTFNAYSESKLYIAYHAYMVYSVSSVYFVPSVYIVHNANIEYTQCRGSKQFVHSTHCARADFVWNICIYIYIRCVSEDLGSSYFKAWAGTAV